MKTMMKILIMIQVVIVCVFAFMTGWACKARQDQYDLKPNIRIGQKVAIKYLEQFIDDGKDTAENAWFRNEKKYLSYGQAIVVGIEWWPSKNKGMGYWVGSTDPGYKAFMKVEESELIILGPKP